MDNISFDTLLQLLLQFMGPEAEQMAQQLLGSPSFGRNIITNNPLKSLAWNAAAASRGREISTYLGGYGKHLGKVAAQNMRTNLYKMMGWGATAAKKEGENGEDNVLSNILESLLITPQIDAATSEVGGAIHSRYAEWDWRAPVVGAQNIQDTIHKNYGPERRFFSEAYWKAGGKLFDTVLADATNHRIMGLGVEDSAKLTAQMIKRGHLDGIAESTIIQSGVPAESSISVEITEGKEGYNRAFAQRVSGFKRTLSEYASAVNALQDVVQGPMEEILKSFERLTGNNMMAMAPGRARNIANTFRNVLMTGNVTARDVATLTAQQYGLIAPFGGTLTQASQMALSTAAAIGSGVKIEGLSDIQLGEAVNKNNTVRMLNGENRVLAAAYTHWRQARGFEDDPSTQDMFLRRIRSDNKGSVQEWAARYVQDNKLDTAFIMSPLVDASAASPTFTSMLAEESLSNFQVFRGRLFEDLAKEGGGSEQVQLARRAELDRATSGVWDPIVLQDRLSKISWIGPTKAATVAWQMTTEAEKITQNANSREAMGILGSTEGRIITARRDLLGNQFRLLGDIKVSKGLEGLKDYMLSAHDRVTVAGAISSYLGLPDGHEVTTTLRNWAESGETVVSVEQLSRVVKDYYKDSNDLPADTLSNIITSIKSLSNYGILGDSVAFSQSYTMVDEKIVREARKQLSAHLTRGRVNPKDAPVLTRSQVRDYGYALGIDERTADRIWLTGETGRTQEISEEEFTEFKNIADKLVKEEPGMEATAVNKWVESEKTRIQNQRWNPNDESGRRDIATFKDRWFREEREKKLKEAGYTPGKFGWRKQRQLDDVKQEWIRVNKRNAEKDGKTFDENSPAAQREWQTYYEEQVKEAEKEALGGWSEDNPAVKAAYQAAEERYIQEMQNNSKGSRLAYLEKSPSFQAARKAAAEQWLKEDTASILTSPSYMYIPDSLGGMMTLGTGGELPGRDPRTRTQQKRLQEAMAKFDSDQTSDVNFRKHVAANVQQQLEAKRPEIIREYALKAAVEYKELKNTADIVRSSLGDDKSDEALKQRLVKMYEEGSSKPEKASDGTVKTPRYSEFASHIESLAKHKGINLQEGTPEQRAAKLQSIISDISTDDSVLGFLRNILQTLTNISTKMK